MDQENQQCNRTEIRRIGESHVEMFNWHFPAGKAFGGESFQQRRKHPGVIEFLYDNFATTIFSLTVDGTAKVYPQISVKFVFEHVYSSKRF